MTKAKNNLQGKNRDGWMTFLKYVLICSLGAYGGPAKLAPRNIILFSKPHNYYIIYVQISYYWVYII